MNKEYRNIENCRACDSANISLILDLGVQPLANSLKRKSNESEHRYPLTLVFCRDCSTVQLKETVKKEILFDSYLWVTGTSGTAKKYAETFYKRTINITKVRPGDLIVEIASNDGTFLKPFIEGGYNVVGVEPAKNIAEIAQKAQVKTVVQYWNTETAKQVVSNYGKAKVVIARNVIPHVSELQDVINGIQLCLDADGIGIIEFHYAGTILSELHYDSIYHEHLCYFSIRSIEHLLNRFGLFSFHIDLSPISGGSYVIYFSKNKRPLNQRYRRLINRERDLGVNSLISWERFADKAKEHKKKSKEIIEPFKRKTIIGFGASARSSTYLNFCGFTSSKIKAIIDNNKLKQGLYTPGSSILIVSIEEGFKMKPDLLFILAWNFRDEIIKECKNRGYEGNYLISFPNTPYLLRR